MRKIVCLILIMVGVICIPKLLLFNGIYEMIGGFIGVSVLTFLPAYFLLRRGISTETKKETNMSTYYNLRLTVFFILFCVATILFYLKGIKLTEVDSKLMILFIYVGFLCLIYQLVSKKK